MSRPEDLHVGQRVWLHSVFFLFGGPHPAEITEVKRSFCRVGEHGSSGGDIKFRIDDQGCAGKPRNSWFTTEEQQRVSPEESHNSFGAFCKFLQEYELQESK